MDTKLKNYHKLTAMIVALIILLPSLAMMVIRPHYIRQKSQLNELSYAHSGLMYQLVNDCYVLYGEEIQSESSKTLNPYDIFFSSGSQTSESNKTDENTDEDFIVQDIEDKYNNWLSEFSHLRSYMEYDVLDGDAKNIIDTNRGSMNAKDSLYNTISGMRTQGILNEDSDYAFAAIIEYGEKGNVKSTAFLSHEKDTASQVLNEIAKQSPTDDYDDYYDFHKSFQKPQSRIYCFAMTKSALTSFQENDYSDYFLSNSDSNVGDLLVVFLGLTVFVSLAALLLPFVKPLQTGEEKVFHMPFELVITVGSIVAGAAESVLTDPYALNTQSIYNVLTSIGAPELLSTILQYLWGLLGWIFLFTLCYWVVGCLRTVFTMGLKRYIKERVLIYRIWPWLYKLCRNTYDGLLHINLKDESSRALLKIVLINFIILGLISLTWFFGIGALVVYSIALFFLLRKYLRKIQDQYQLLLEATNELAKGNLNGTIPEDLGVFEPFRNEISKIQMGFSKAVDEEVKSTKMKTDLITNVSHDLKTPLTAIITYVDLLKQEDLPEEERKRYIQILDQKANRLKILIEDLFEISKATSKTVTLNIMDIDIVSLLRQVKLELQDKIDATDLVFRWQLPEEKVILPLDSQRTYRVFENLLVNITKYAMPGTRVYVNMENTENHVKIIMKNISATELNFNPNEITERFVRGDSSRNTEGSGLGLAIAKSFTELQGGRLEVLTDADLFTVEITFLK
ncbi:MAG TPA: HAMP domain-containing histidine kinase [Candidatus Blautia stercoravium]|nr:HAMP domain-containing histidine kinase [Candidatus Blautia stercoravium]